MKPAKRSSDWRACGSTNFVRMPAEFCSQEDLAASRRARVVLMRASTEAFFGLALGLAGMRSLDVRGARILLPKREVSEDDL